MSLWKIAWRSIQQRSLSSTLTAFSMSLGVALVVAVLVVHAKVQQSFDRTAAGYDLIVGAKGGRYELVLNSVFYLGQPVGNIKYSYYKEFQPGARFNRSGVIKYAIPICLGDSYTAGDYQFRVVATAPDFFDKLEYARDKHFEFAAGRNFETKNFYEAVLGSVASAQTGLKVGDKFRPEHGVPEEAGIAHVHDAFEVVGVLEPTGTAVDRALYVNVEGFYKMPEHVAPGEPARPKAASERGHADEHEHDAESHDEHAHDDHAHDKEPHDPHDKETKKGDEPSSSVEKEDDHAHEGESHDEHEHEESEKAESDAKSPAAKDAHGHDEAEHDEHGHTGASEGEHAHDDDAHDEHGAAGHDDHGHDHHDHAHDDEPLPEEQREVSAVLIRFEPNAALTAASMTRSINKGNEAQAVSPLQIVTMMRDNYIGPLKILLLALAGLVVVVSAVGVMVSIYNTMNDRRREIAILRSLGAARGTVMAIVLCESLLLSIAGCLAGFIFGHVATAALSPVLVPRTGVTIGLFDFSLIELAVVPALGLASALVGFVPALTAYRTDVAKTLSATG